MFFFGGGRGYLIGLKIRDREFCVYEILILFFFSKNVLSCFFC